LALEEAANLENRKSWASAGQENIADMGLQPEKQALKLDAIIEKLRG